MRLQTSIKFDTHVSFNPRICKRCDSEVYSACALVNCFNPRICKRCDDEDGNAFKVDFVSIHASVKDATYAYDVSDPN